MNRCRGPAGYVSDPLPPTPDLLLIAFVIQEVPFGMSVLPPGCKPHEDMVSVSTWFPSASPAQGAYLGLNKYLNSLRN